MNKRGFTVIEMIIVIAIMVILAGLISAAAMNAKQKGYIAKAKATIASLEVALSMYESDTGLYPADDGAESCINLVNQLRTGGTAPPSGWNGPYMDFDTNELDTNGNLKDPWGRPYIYDQPGANNISSYDLSSKGPNTAITTDDITNW